ncbi:MAG: UPF0104 family protein [Candidatus Dadabacteria bacterium]|nr:MAG: UPF0104 family protein [Candidatus Dadabacteria bacterium]
MKNINTKKLLGTIIGLALIVALAFVVNWHELAKALSHLTLKIIIALLIVSYILIYLSALKWKILMEEFHEKINTSFLFKMYLVGYFVNLLLPSFVGGDITRSYFVSNKKGKHHESLAATIMERSMGLLAMVILSLVGLIFMKNVPQKIVNIVLLTAAVVVLSFVIIISPSTASLIKKIIKNKKLISHISRFHNALNQCIKNKSLFAKALLLSLLFHTTTVINTAIAALGVGWYNFSIADIFSVLPVILLIGSLPVTPSGLGIQEGAFLYFLHQIGATKAQALSIALVLRAKNYLLALLGSIIWFSYFKNLKKNR